MTFLSKIENVFQQFASKQISSELSPLKLWTNQAVRCMSSMGSSKVFIGGVAYQTDDASLREAFGKYGDVVDGTCTNHHRPGEASSAIQALDGQDLHGRRVRVNYSAERPRDNFGYSGGDGGYLSAGSYNIGGGKGGYNSYGNDSYNNAGNHGSGNSYETASGGRSGNNKDFGPLSGADTGGGDNCGGW